MGKPRDRDDWLRDASGNKMKRKLIKEMRTEQAQAEALRFEASLKGERPPIRPDWGLSEYFHSKAPNGQRMISRIRFLLPFAIPESTGKKLVEKFSEVFDEIVYKEKEEEKGYRT